ncbi:MAG: mandelate racemase/muconate lactonizing enzyme family protein [Betaproteobacteria bacterium]
MSTIAAVEAFCVNVSPKTHWTFLRIRTDAGESGWGECSLNSWEPMLIAAVEMLRGDLVGRSTQTALGALAIVLHSPGGTVMHAARSAAEQAITDIEAQRAGRPLHAMLRAESRAAVPAYANINRGIAERSPEGFAQAARAAVDAGYRNVKIAPFDGVVSVDAASTPIDDRIARGVDRIRAVRAAIGNHRSLMVDCHWRFDAGRAEALMRTLRDVGLYWIECPISEHPAQFSAIGRLRAIARENGMRLAGGEAIVAVEQAESMCAAELYDVLMPDIKYAGGYRGMMAMSRVCALNGVAFSPHNPSGPIAHLASVHLSAAAPALLWLEHQWAETPRFDALVGGHLPALVDGAFAVPEEPGLGATLDLALAATLPYRPVPKEALLDERLG